MCEVEDARAFTTALSVIKGSMAIDASSPNIPVYKLKRIDFFGRTVPIALQNENGPCPLLAIANVLLLRKQIELPEQAPDVSQNRLVSLVAGYLLDANDEQKLGKNLPEEYKANLRKNVSDAIAILAKLTTGIDVNVRFHDVKGFEFTDEISIFDLMDISLVHGWLVDPQDSIAASALGQKSYNEAVEQLILLLGDATPKRLITPQLSRHTSGLSTPRRSTSSLTAGAITTPKAAPTTASSGSAAAKPASPSLQAPPPPSTPSTGTIIQPEAKSQAATLSDGPVQTPVAEGTGASALSASNATDVVRGAPMGAITSQYSNSSAAVHDAATSEGPSGSLVSVQATASQAPAHATTPDLDAEQLQSSSYLQLAKQQHAPLTSPAAEPTIQQHQHVPADLSTPSADVITPQTSSTQVDAHIAGAPTPYPSLASGWSQPNSPETPKGDAGQATALSKALEAAAAQSVPQSSSVKKSSPLAQTTSAASDEAAAAAKETPGRSDASSEQNPASVSSEAAVQSAPGVVMPSHASAAAEDTSTSGVGQSSAVEHPAAGVSAPQHSAAATPAGLEAAALQLDEADSDQLQAALALSLDADTAALGTQFADVSIKHDGSNAGQQPSEVQSPEANKPSGTASPSEPAGHADAEGSSNAAPPQQEQQPSANQSDHPNTVSAVTADDQAKPSHPVLNHSSADDSHVPRTATATSHSQQQTPGPPLLEEHDLSLLTPVSTSKASTSADLQEVAPRPNQDDTPMRSQQSAGSSMTGEARQQSGPGSRRSTNEGEQSSQNAAEAHIIQDFLDSTSSQLTEHGLGSLQEGLRPNELAVFFRNNHFNTLFLHKGVLHILVTDQGYEYEKNVVWERLDNVMGNTQFLKADFQPYGASSLSEQVSDAADLMQAAFAGAPASKRSAAQGSDGVDADYALAMQLQEEEQRRASQHQQARQQHQQQQPRTGSRSRPQQSGTRADARSRDVHNRPPSGRQSAQAFANPMMQQQAARRQAAAQPQAAEKPTSAFARFFGWGKK